ncbi:MAG: xylulose 5-phosphate 3-epimerase, partial [Dehalococcoidia bacterium]
RLAWAGYQADSPRLVLTAVGAYQLDQALRASARLAERAVPHSVVSMLEPGRFRISRAAGEAQHAAPDSLKAELYPDTAPARVFVVHTRPEPLLGTLAPLSTGPRHTAALGFVNHGGTMNIAGLLFANRCSWAHVLAEAARVLELPREELLTADELAALDGVGSPESVLG